LWPGCTWCCGGKAKEEPDVHPDEEVGKESVPAADTGEKETK